MHDLDDTPRCTACGRHLYADELAHYGCRICLEQTDRILGELAGPHGLYAQLAHALMPTANASGPAVSGSRTAPVPLRLEVLNLQARGGVVTILQTWLIDWFELLDYRHPRWRGDLQQQLDDVVKRLRVNLPWAAAAHPAFDDFAREAREIAGACRGQITGERPPRRVTVACPCGGTLKVTLDSPGARCPECSEQYGHTEVLQLPLAERNAA